MALYTPFKGSPFPLPPARVVPRSVSKLMMTPNKKGNSKQMCKFVRIHEIVNVNVNFLKFFGEYEYEVSDMLQRFDEGQVW